ncbi:sulfatase-like hydrolase/transferase [uncultured Polaribacter sp.]|uniref:sulfatase-like hydrolase/transferase n=1 Tax=uncultured Polaribacter sp. TaxID=174711 RepID=UPI00260A87F2|nr:sulfatase-like hydrolase/transferase [uncultured Polaribacter sp.]
MNVKIKLFLTFILCTQLLSSQNKKPNIILIVADDLGYSDVSSFGGEIPTPNIDNLAENGARFIKFYVSPMCVTSRVAILSGIEFIAAGKGSFPKGESIAKLMREEGYTTNLVGKNHGMGNLKIGNKKTDFGFDHFFGFTGGQINSFTGKGNAKWQNDGKIFPNTDLPKDFYATNNFTDYAIKYMDEAIKKDKPFFSMVSYNAPHSPLDAPEKNVRKFYDPKKGINVYKKGWIELRKERLARMKKMGIVDKDTQLPKLGVEIPDWDLLPEKSSKYWEIQKDFEALSRSAYAGMVDNMDENIGRITAFLKDPNQDGNTNDSQLENTIIIFISDNGGCYAGLHTNRNALPWSPQNRGAGFTTNYGWAALSNTPFSSYKHGSGEGAIRSPMIVHWPEGLKLKKNSINKQMIRIWDLFPTFLELAGGKYPNDKKELMGKSMLPLLKNEKFQEEKFFVSAFYRSKGIIKGDWKLVSFFDSPFELYNLKNDPTETENVHKKHQTKYKELLNSWNDYTQKHGFNNDKLWNMPTGDKKRGFGYDRVKNMMVKASPEFMEDNVCINQKLTFTFNGKVTFANTNGRKIRLQKYGSQEILWSKDLDINSDFEGEKEIVFKDFPTLESNTHYYITWDAGWVKIKQKGKMKPIQPVRESAFAYRFRTSSK